MRSLQWLTQFVYLAKILSFDNERHLMKVILETRREQ
jgi:hypothetical protein